MGKRRTIGELARQLPDGAWRADYGACVQQRLMSRRIGPIALAALSIVALACAVGLFLLLYAASVHAFLPDSDGATPVLEANAMMHGHPLLSGWAISLDSFWLVDTVWYMLAIVLVGIHPFLMHAVPALIGTLVVILGVVIATDERRGAAALAAGGVVVAVLGLPSHAWANFFLRGPWHIGTALWALIAFYALRKPRFGWGFAVAVVFLTAGMLGDLQMAAIGVGPLFIAGLFAMARQRQLKAGTVQVAAALGSAALWEIVRRITKAIGAFSIAPANPHAGFHQMLINVRHGLHEATLLLGTGSSYYGLGGAPSGLSDVHIVSVVVVGLAAAAAVVALVWGILSGRETVVASAEESGWRLDDMLVLAAMGGFAAYCFLAFNADPTFARYLITPLIFLTILAGRMVGRIVSQGNLGVIGRLAAGLGLAVAGCYGAVVAFELNQPAPVQPVGALASFLESHGLTRGLGAYWTASIVTVQSSDKVIVRPVVTHDGRVYRYTRNSASYWYGGSFQFLVYDTALPFGGVDSTTAAATFGRPARTYTVNGIYKVLVWPKPIRVATKS